MPRPVELQDLPAVAALESLVFPGAPYPAFFFRQAVDLWPALFWVAAPHDLPLAYALGATGHDGTWLLSMAVAPHVRGTGVGRRLLLDWLGATRGDVWLTVAPENPATRLYASVGFTALDVEPDYFGPDQPRHRMFRPADASPAAR